MQHTASSVARVAPGRVRFDEGAYQQRTSPNARPQQRGRRVAAAGEGRSANRTKWASGELSGGAAGAAVLEPPQAAAPEQQQQQQQLDASELVRRGRGSLPALRAFLPAAFPLAESPHHFVIPICRCGRLWRRFGLCLLTLTGWCTQT